MEQRRARRGVTLTPLDAAVLRYTGQYVHGSTLPRRIPEAVPDALLPEVMQVIATAEKATAPLRIARDARRGATGTDPDDWRRKEAAVATALQGSYDDIADDAVKSVAFLMCTEAGGRASHDPFDTDAERTTAGSASRASTADRVRRADNAER